MTEDEAMAINLLMYSEIERGEKLGYSPQAIAGMTALSIVLTEFMFLNLVKFHPSEDHEP